MSLSMLGLTLFYILMGLLVLIKEVLTGPAEQQDVEKTETEGTNQIRFMAEIALNGYDL